MPGYDNKKRKKTLGLSSSIKLDELIREEFFRFYKNVTCRPGDVISWSFDSIRNCRKSNVLDPACIQNNELDCNFSNSENVTSSNDLDNLPDRKDVLELSKSCQDVHHSNPSLLHFSQIIHLSNFGLCPAKMSPPSAVELHSSRKRSQPVINHTDLDCENVPLKKLFKIKADDKFDSDFKEEIRFTSPFSRVRRSIFNGPKKESEQEDPIISPEKNDKCCRVSPDAATAERDSDDDVSILSLEISEESDSDDKSVHNAEDSAELFRPRKGEVPKEVETSILTTPPLALRRTPRATRSSARRLFDGENDEPETPRTPRSSKLCQVTPKSSRTQHVNRTPKLNVKSLTPSRGRIQTPLRTPTTPRDRAKHALALSAAPESLPCRGKEFRVIYDFVYEKISSKESGVLCINGVPGSGKTATINRVLKKLVNQVEKKSLNKFKAVQINAFDLRRSKDIYRKIQEQLTGRRTTVKIAEQLLTNKFESKRRTASHLPTVLIIDEFDCLLARKRDVIYKMVEWQVNDNSQLVLLTIANKLDFSDEKKLFSRIKFEKLAFIAYSFQELEQIIANRLNGFTGFQPEAIQFIARKVAATSGDARKALDICRQVLDTVEAEIENFSFTMEYVNKLLQQIFSNPYLKIIRQLTDLEKVALRALRDVLKQKEKPFCSLWGGVWQQFDAICTIDGFASGNCNGLLQIYDYLASIGLVKLEIDNPDQHSKIWLKCDMDVIQEALTKSR